LQTKSQLTLHLPSETIIIGAKIGIMDAINLLVDLQRDLENGGEVDDHTSKHRFDRDGVAGHRGMLPNPCMRQGFRQLYLRGIEVNSLELCEGEW
jgi:hypothetical protein